MTDDSIARPDVTLTLDRDGVIQTASASEGLADEALEAWRGRPWRETMDPAGSADFARRVRDGAQSGSPSCFQVSQRFPSGRELPMEYTTISLGESAGFVAIGRNLKAVADLQSRLDSAQQDREQDYWKLREFEARYRLLFEASAEAALLVRVTNLRIIEANAAAAQALGVSPGAEFLPDLPARDKKIFGATLDKVRELGRAPGIVVHLGAARDAWSLRASLMKTDSGSYYLFQLAPVGVHTSLAPKRETFSTDEIIRRLPDGFAVIDRDGVICRANHTFLDLVQIGAEPAVVGQNLARWLARPGADAATLLGLLQRHGAVRVLASALTGELGSTTEVEISAVGDKDSNADYFGLMLRDVTMRLRGEAPSGAVDAGAAIDDGRSLNQLVKSSREAIERRTIIAALERSYGNRTLAARHLGMSRQSLHTKLNKYKVAET